MQLVLSGLRFAELVPHVLSQPKTGFLNVYTQLEPETADVTAWAYNAGVAASTKVAEHDLVVDVEGIGTVTVKDEMVAWSTLITRDTESLVAQVAAKATVATAATRTSAATEPR